MVAQVGYSVAGRSKDRVAPCAVGTWHVETRSAGFLVEPQSQGRWFVSGLASKSVVMVFTGLASKPVATVFAGLPQNQWRRFSPVWPQNWWRQFIGLAMKIKWASVCRLRHKTDGGRSARNIHQDLADCFTW
jgi:hypothetical protein